jgi:hypothetical protein
VKYGLRDRPAESVIRVANSDVDEEIEFSYVNDLLEYDLPKADQ